MCFSVNCSTWRAAFIVTYVRPVALREPVSENSPLSPAEEDDRAVATGFSLPWSGDPLLK
jgi:hypothetical protein